MSEGKANHRSMSDVSDYLSKSLASRVSKQDLINKKIIKDPESISFKGEALMVKLQHRRTPSTLAKLNVIKEFDADPDQSSPFGNAKEQLEKAMKKDRLADFIAKRPSQESLLRARIIVDEAETLAAGENKADDNVGDLGALPQPMRRSTASDAKVLSGRQFASDAKFDQVGCGWAHTILRETGSGKLHSVGNGSRLGNGTANDSFKLGEVKDLEKVSVFSVADNHNIVVSGGKVFTWGDGTWSKLGHGNVEDQTSPKQVAALNDVEIVHAAAGGYHSLAVSSTGEVYAWGWGKNGRLGIPLEEKVEEVEINIVEALPKKVAFPEGVKIVKVAAGQNSSAAISSEGHLYVWGSGRWGCLGLGASEADHVIPALVESLKAEQVVDVSVGDSHMIAQTKSHKVYTWGRNDSGQLGRSEQKQDGTPAEVSLSGSVVSVAAGKSHCLALVSGKVFAWGLNSAGQLGLGTTGKEKAPTAITLSTSAEPVAVSGGWSHSVVVCADGTAFGFGSNLKNQLGFANQ